MSLRIWSALGNAWSFFSHCRSVVDAWAEYPANVSAEPPFCAAPVTGRTSRAIRINATERLIARLQLATTHGILLRPQKSFTNPPHTVATSFSASKGLKFDISAVTESRLVRKIYFVLRHIHK
jgi:hypothetical protein